MKRCSKCRAELPLGRFDVDRSRRDGRAYVCKPCKTPRTKEGPSKPERQVKRAEGLAWCRDCREWLPTSSVYRGLCRPHANASDRQRYAESATYRAERRQHSHSRKRGVDPVPALGQEVILEDFGGLCAYCDEPATTWEHIVPVSAGGKTTPGNIAPACARCNSSKRTRSVDEFVLKNPHKDLTHLIDRLVLAECGFYG